jgi:membrane protein required for beta-lactamase induction
MHTYGQYKSLGTPQVNRAYLQRALLDENVQYLLLALYWFLQVGPFFAVSHGTQILTMHPPRTETNLCHVDPVRDLFALPCP